MWVWDVYACLLSCSLLGCFWLYVCVCAHTCVHSCVCVPISENRIPVLPFKQGQMPAAIIISCITSPIKYRVHRSLAPSDKNVGIFCLVVLGFYWSDFSSLITVINIITITIIVLFRMREVMLICWYVDMLICNMLILVPSIQYSWTQYWVYICIHALTHTNTQTHTHTSICIYRFSFINSLGSAP